MLRVVDPTLTSRASQAYSQRLDAIQVLETQPPKRDTPHTPQKHAAQSNGITLGASARVSRSAAGMPPGLARRQNRRFRRFYYIV